MNKIGEVTVGKVRGKGAVGAVRVKIDRTGPLGNPFYMKSEGMRDEVCEKHAAWFDKEVKKQGSATRTAIIGLYRRVRAGESVQLDCHCAPRRCHGDKIKSFIEEALKRADK